MSWVYFIKPIGMDGPIKVGCSFSPDKRRRTLDTWSPFALEIVAQIEGGFDLEHRFHALFVETHQRREWFGWSKRIAATIAAINDGTFNIHTLPTAINVSAAPRKGKGSRLSEWTPARRFASAYIMRAHALKRLGMPWGEYCDGPSFYAYAYGNGPYADRHERAADLPAHIRECEAFADALTAKYGHSGMKPVRWNGPFPTPTPTPERAGRIAA
jgi:hypothetical protein